MTIDDLPPKPWAERPEGWALEFGRLLSWQPVTLGELLDMNDTAEFHKIELSPHGVVTISPRSQGRDHSRKLTELMCWLFPAVVEPTDILQGLGILVTLDGREGGRIPDLVMLRQGELPEAWIPGSMVELAVEVSTAATHLMDRVIKMREYEASGIEHYWIVDLELVARWRLINGRYFELPSIAWADLLAAESPRELLERTIGPGGESLLRDPLLLGGANLETDRAARAAWRRQADDDAARNAGEDLSREPDDWTPTT